MNKVSVIIRCFNESKNLPVLLETLKSQTLQPLEIIVIDSGSVDNTVQIAEDNGARVLHIAHHEFSFGRALNRGAIAALGDILVFVSAHAYPATTQWIEKIVEPFHSEQIVLVYGGQRGDERSYFSERRLFQQWFPDDPVDEQSHPFCNNANAAVRRKAWEVLPYDEQIPGLEDIHWAKRAQEQGLKIAYRPDAMIVHVHEESFSQIYRRYLREAIGLQFVSPWEKMSLFHALELMAKAIKSDLLAAKAEGVLRKEIFSIWRFRVAQYLGAYRGMYWSHPESSDLRARLYYPKGFEPNKPSSQKVPLSHAERVYGSSTHKNVK